MDRSKVETLGMRNQESPSSINLDETCQNESNVSFSIFVIEYKSRLGHVTIRIEM